MSISIRRNVRRAASPCMAVPATDISASVSNARVDNPRTTAESSTTSNWYLDMSSFALSLLDGNQAR